MTPRQGRAPNRSRVVALTLYAHPFELAVALMLAVSAVTAIGDQELAAILEPALVATWVIANVLGITAIVVGLFGSADLDGRHPRRRARYRATEKAGLLLVAGTTLAYAVLLEARLPLALSWAIDAQLGGLAAACILRALAIRKAERITLEELRRVSAEQYVAAVRRHPARRRTDREGRP